MPKYFYRTLCVLLAFALGVAAAQITIAIRQRLRNTPTKNTKKEETQPAPFIFRKRIWPEPRSLNLELIDTDRLAYRGYLVKRLFKTVDSDDGDQGAGRASTLRFEVSYASLTQGGKVLARFDDGVYHPTGNSTTFGLMAPLGVRTKQLLIAQTIWRGGAFWIVNFAPRYQVIYSSREWQIGSDTISAIDVDQDGVDEILQVVTAFYDLQDKLPISQIPFPEVIFKFDAQAGKYFPANTLHYDYLLRDVEEAKQKISAPSNSNFNHLADVLKIALRLVYAGEEKEGWEFFDRAYQLSDKEAIKARVIAVLEDEPVYKFIYKNRVQDQDALVTLPANMKSVLDKKFPGWRYLPVDHEIRTFLEDNVSRYVRPDLIKGDFDGNGRIDYAALIEESHTPRLVVFLTKVAGFDIEMLDPDGAYITLIKRGYWDYNYEGNQYFTYENDAIFAGIFEKGGTSYVYQRGSFRSILTSD